MIKVLITDFFNEIEKRELKKNKNAIATFWVEELQEANFNDRNYVSIKKATRLYDKYVEGRENVIVKEPNKYLLDFMSQYVIDKDFDYYKSTKEPTIRSVDLINEPNKPEVPKKPKDKTFKEKYKKPIAGISISLIFLAVFLIYKYNNTNSGNCIVWNENHFETSSCKAKNAINNSFYTINIDQFKKVEVDEETTFFENGKAIIWYGKSRSKKMEFFTSRGIHPETLKELDPVTEYIINKYVFTAKENKTILQ
ncbi:hypothetical protein [uncultured Polaribacter sp.]|uniref:hypothetical protein n=1 Tax=uncultured Polaribacter sp. TaxID=174711 RepID=UPI002637718D|nr:hypothetical protein [uncultured Polaribacter sp.]